MKGKKRKEKRKGGKKGMGGEKKGEGIKGKEGKKMRGGNTESHSGAQTCDLLLYSHYLPPQGRIARASR